MMYPVYILKSAVKDRFYIGCSNNFERRFSEHNNRKVKSTKAFVPWKIVYKKEFDSRTETYKREKQIKSYKSGSAFQKLLNPESWQSG